MRADMSIRLPEVPDFQLVMHIEADIDVGYRRMWADGPNALDLENWHVGYREATAERLETIALDRPTPLNAPGRADSPRCLSIRAIGRFTPTQSSGITGRLSGCKPGDH